MGWVLETPEQLAIAKDAGFDLLQGYLLRRPAPNCVAEVSLEEGGELDAGQKILAALQAA